MVVRNFIIGGRPNGTFPIEQHILWKIQDRTMGDNPAKNEDSPTLQDILDALDDPDCRIILKESTEPMTAKELTKTCDIPKSTLYRKLDLLNTASLVREVIDIHPDRGQVTRYQRDFNDVIISMKQDNEFSVTIDRPERTVDERLENMWSKMSDEL